MPMWALGVGVATTHLITSEFFKFSKVFPNDLFQSIIDRNHWNKCFWGLERFFFSKLHLFVPI